MELPVRELTVAYIICSSVLTVTLIRDMVYASIIIFQLTHSVAVVDKDVNNTSHDVQQSDSDI
jgi:hypothetical protein